MLKDALNHSSRRMHLRTQAICCVANVRDGYGYHCALRLASHSHPERLLTARIIQSLPTHIFVVSLMSFVLIRSRRFILAALALTVAVAGMRALPAQSLPADFPNKPVRLVVPYPPGGTADILARDLGTRLSEELGQTIVIENRAGAGTAIGARHVAFAASDGYTLFLGTSTSHVMNPAVNPQEVGYDPVDDFTPLAAIGEVSYAIVTRPDRGIASFQDLIAQAEQGERPLSYASAGQGSANHLAGELLANLAGIQLLHVPYKGSAPALNDVLAGQVDFMFDLATTSQAHIQSGRLQALAVTAPDRVPALPDVPTTAEQGRPELVVSSWFGVFAPAGLPAGVEEKLATSLQKVLADEDNRANLARHGLTVLPLVTSDFATFVRRDLGYWQGVVRAADVGTKG